MKGALAAPFYLFCSCYGGVEFPVRQNALAFWAPQAGRRPENRSEAIRANPLGSTQII